jgi:hypothetical protein
MLEHLKESQDTFSVQDIYVVKGLTKPLLGRPAIQALGIISNVNCFAPHLW